MNTSRFSWNRCETNPHPHTRSAITNATCGNSPNFLQLRKLALERVDHIVIRDFLSSSVSTKTEEKFGCAKTGLSEKLLQAPGS